MPFESEADAAQQLYESVLADGTARSDEQEVHDLTQAARQGESTEVESGATEEDTFTSIDPNTLPEELLPVYKSMQADYTRKTQGLSQERSQYEQLAQYGGVDTALEAIQFANALATDPNYAMQVHSQLTEALTQAGLTPAQASQEAARQVNEAAAQGTASDDFSFGEDEYGDNPAVKKLEQELASMRSELQAQADWRRSQEEQAFNIQLANQMAAQENAILNAHPEYDEQDLEKIYTISYAYGGDLNAANQVYESMRNDVIADYIAKKGAVPTGATSVGGSAQSVVEEAPKFEGLFDKRLTRLVNERLAQELAAD